MRIGENFYYSAFKIHFRDKNLCINLYIWIFLRNFALVNWCIA